MNPRSAITVPAVALIALLANEVVSEPASPAATGGSCPVTVPPALKDPLGPPLGPGRFNYGDARIRVQLNWPRGILFAGVLPDGGSMGVINPDGSIYVKLGWWRGVPGRLRITGRRLDAPAPPLRADVPPNESYGDVGFIPSGLTFPTVGCWRVTGRQGEASLTFVVEVREVAGCRSIVHSDVIPVWARGGFTSPRPRVPYVLGRSGKIAAILFGYPLLYPPPRPPRQNKILWVSRLHPEPATKLRISAQRMRGPRGVGLPVTRVVRGGPGPSVIDLPKAGCWRLALRWSGKLDSLDLQYKPNRS